MPQKSDILGKKPIGQLLIQQGLPAAIGIFTLSVNGIIDTIFVGRWLGKLEIAAIGIVIPIVFLIASVGMAIGVGGGSMISRALGRDDKIFANRVFGNQLSLCLLLSCFSVVAGATLDTSILRLFGAQGAIMPPAFAYYAVMLVGIPFLAFAMMSNNVFRAEGKAKVAMLIMLIPAFINIILDPIFIVWLKWGIEGAAWATTISYVCSGLYGFIYFASNASELKFSWSNMLLQATVVKEITALGFVTFARQSAVSLLSIVLNHSLFLYGGATGVAVYAIVNRLVMFINFPVLGINQGFIPIVGYNYGAKEWQRVKTAIHTAIIYGSILSFIIFGLIFLFATPIVSIFTIEKEVIELSAFAVVVVFLATPTLAIQLIGASYYQAIGKAKTALLLTLVKQGFALIPLVLVLPLFLGLNGNWVAFPIADLIAAIINWYFLKRAVKRLPLN